MHYSYSKCVVPWPSRVLWSFFCWPCYSISLENYFFLHHQPLCFSEADSSSVLGRGYWLRPANQRIPFSLHTDWFRDRWCCSQSQWESMTLAERDSVLHIPTGLEPGPEWAWVAILPWWDESAENGTHAPQGCRWEMERWRLRPRGIISAPGSSSMQNDKSLYLCQ